MLGEEIKVAPKKDDVLEFKLQWEEPDRLADSAEVIG